jgi:hypothetical protein
MSHIAQRFDPMAYGSAPDAAYAWLDDHNRKFDRIFSCCQNWIDKAHKHAPPCAMNRGDWQ